MIPRNERTVDVCDLSVEDGSMAIDRAMFGMPVLHETAHELVVIKSAGMATELTSDPRGASLISRVREALPAEVDARLPHRLDRVTRGLVVVALSDKAIAFHDAQIRAGNWEKIYLARVMLPESDTLDELIGVHKMHLRRDRGRAEVVRSGGKRALTEILAWAPVPAQATDRSDEAHVLIRLLTGRFHQIRATMAALGAPLVDDWLYGSSAGTRRRPADERFYLEHTALRFTPFNSDRPAAVHWTNDPDRETMSPTLLARLDGLLDAWTSDGAVRIGG